MLAGLGTITAQNAAKFEFKAEVMDYGDIQKGSDGTKTFTFKYIF